MESILPVKSKFKLLIGEFVPCSGDGENTLLCPGSVCAEVLSVDVDCCCKDQRVSVIASWREGGAGNLPVCQARRQ